MPSLLSAASVGRSDLVCRVRPRSGSALRSSRRELERYLSPENVVVEEFAFAPAACLERVSGERCSDFWPVLHARSKERRYPPWRRGEPLGQCGCCRVVPGCSSPSPTLISSHMGGDQRMRTLSSIALAIIVLVSPTFARNCRRRGRRPSHSTTSYSSSSRGRGLKWEEPADPVQKRPHLFRRYQGSRCVPDHDVRRATY